MIISWETIGRRLYARPEILSVRRTITYRGIMSNLIYGRRLCCYWCLLYCGLIMEFSIIIVTYECECEFFSNAFTRKLLERLQ